MPCYNCFSTVEESLISIYEQDLSVPFEIIMIDDGSTGKTPTLLERLAERYEFVRLIKHEKNRGGGAARNTGIKEAKGKLIFILDSDDILPSGILPKMIFYLEKNSCDGIVFAETVYFYGELKNARKKKTSYKLDCLSPIVLSDLFLPEKGHLTAANFLFTKESYLKTEGYPENHGFDTQCFGVRYLANRFKVLACPDSYYYHRKANKKSYFERVYENGEFSKNYYLIYEDILPLFSEKTIGAIMKYDIFKKSGLEINLKNRLEELFKKNPQDFFRKDANDYYSPSRHNLFYETYQNSSKPTDIFCLGVGFQKNMDYQRAIGCYERLIAKDLDTKIVYYNLMRALTGLTAKYETAEIESKTTELIMSLNPALQPGRLSKGLISKLKNDFLNKYPGLCAFYARTKKRLTHLRLS